MSWLPSNDPVLGDPTSCDALELDIVPRTRDLGDGFEVRRALPHGRRQMVGPFIFFDHFGPVQYLAGKGMDVRPHPHIGLATVTYLFDGSIMHRDSEGKDRKSTRLNSSHVEISYAVFCLKKKKHTNTIQKYT